MSTLNDKCSGVIDDNNNNNNNTIGNLFCLLNILPIFFLKLIHCKFVLILLFYSLLLFSLLFYCYAYVVGIY